MIQYAFLILSVFIAISFSACSVSPVESEMSGSQAWTLSEIQQREKINAFNQGSSEAAFELALHYSVTGNVKEQIKWLKKAAEKGHVAAQYNLAYVYEMEPEVKNIELAKYWYLRASQNGNKEAKADLYRLTNLKSK